MNQSIRQSTLSTKTRKNVSNEETSTNAHLLIRGGYIDKLMAGVYSILPLGHRVMQKIEQIIREEINAIDGQELLLPALTPKSIWEATGRWNDMDEIMYKFQDSSEREFALAPTHEDVLVHLMKQFIQSYKDLPVAMYQFQTKFRKELRPKSGILRGREFMMKDLYSFHADEAGLDEYYERAKAAYVKIFQRCGIGDATYVTYASGGMFSKYSHEFQTLTPAGEDVVYVCNHCSMGINKEIKSDTANCPECGQTDFTEHTAIEVGNIFKLMTKFSAPVGLQYADTGGASHDVVMGSYGIGLGRVMGTVVEVNHDANGIMWPEELSPFDIHLINLNKDSVQTDVAYTALQEAGFTVLYDDRDTRAGEKLADADLLGISHRLVMGSKTAEKMEWKPRAGSEIKLVSIKEFQHIHVQ